MTPDSSECMSDTEPSLTNHVKLYYESRKVDVPTSVKDVQDPYTIFNKANFETLPPEDKERLLEMLPGGNKEEKQAVLEKLWDPDSAGYFRAGHPVTHFKSLLDSDYFTERSHNIRKTNEKIYWLDYERYFVESHKHLQKWHSFANSLQAGAAAAGTPGHATEPNSSEHYSRMEEIWKQEVPSDPESVRDLPASVFCQENSSSEDEEPEAEMKASEPSESLEVEDQKAPPSKPKKERKEPKPKAKDELDELMSGDRFQDLKLHKNQLTIKPRSQDWIYWYRRQEAERYANPTRPWLYYNEDGTTSIVAPVCKKPMTASSKPREHVMLKNERPACITILCLARDAASRLPDGIGTRADICELIKDSQYLVEEIPEANVSNIVSGALDRLHYEKDPCVRYDTDRKIWIYLHRTRTIDYPAWADTSSPVPNSVENCSFNPFKAMEEQKKEDAVETVKKPAAGESIVVIKLEEPKPGKRAGAEKSSMAVASAGEQVLEENVVLKKAKK